MSALFEKLFIFEMANNHQGEVEHGLKIIRAMSEVARRRGVNGAVKFQYRDLDRFIHPDFAARQDVPHIPRFQSTRLSRAQFDTLIQATRAEGLLPVVTPFDERSVEVCVEQAIPILKVASSSATDWPLLDAITSAGRPMIVSTGGLTIHQIDNVVSYLTHRGADFAVLHCVSLYPTPNSGLQLGLIQKLLSRYRGVPIGYSGHEAPDNTDPVKLAVALGATILERHVGVPTETITLNRYSMNPEQVERWVEAAQVAREIVGDVTAEKRITEPEIESLRSLKRGVYAARALQRGEAIERSDVYFAMPCASGQTDSGQFGQYRARWTASQAYAPNAPIFEQTTPDAIAGIRAIIHDVKGMLYESRIEFGSDYEIELSHHYGIEQFRQTGAVIINLINREYCKKLVVVLGGQSHPSHRHMIKEETFQLLWGDLEVTRNDAPTALMPGDLLLIERGTWHSFTSVGGAIFEEVSTTHVKSDSYYADPHIASQDPMLRKTVLDEW